MNRRDFARNLFGASVIPLAGASVSAQESKALQPISPQCPRCFRVFGLVRVADGELMRVGKCLTYAPQSEFQQALPVVCDCGWSGTARFFHAAH